MQPLPDAETRARLNASRTVNPNFALRIAQARAAGAREPSRAAIKARAQTAATTGASHEPYSQAVESDSLTVKFNPGAANGVGYTPTVSQPQPDNSVGSGEIAGYELWPHRGSY